MVQVIVWLSPALALGTVVFVVTETVAVFVQLVDVFVTVSVYVPAALTVGVAVVPPLTMPGPAHEYDTGEEVDEPFNVTDEDEQVMVWVLPALAFGSGFTVTT